jgi:hypothetical protein
MNNHKIKFASTLFVFNFLLINFSLSSYAASEQNIYNPNKIFSIEYFYRIESSHKGPLYKFIQDKFFADGDNSTMNVKTETPREQTPSIQEPKVQVASLGTPEIKSLNDKLTEKPKNEISENLTGIKSTYKCATSGTIPDPKKRFTIIADPVCNWIQGDTGHFGTELNGTKDKTPGKTPGFNQSYACTSSMQNYAVGKRVNICDPGLGIVSLPIQIQKYYFGAKSTKARVSNTPIEIVNIKTGECVVGPLWETGPGDGEISQPKAIDLTSAVKKQIGGYSFISKFRPVPEGRVGCEGYKLKFVFKDQVKKITKYANIQ